MTALLWLVAKSFLKPVYLVMQDLPWKEECDGIRESLGLEKTSKIMDSNHHPAHK